MGLKQKSKLSSIKKKFIFWLLMQKLINAKKQKERKREQMAQRGHQRDWNKHQFEFKRPISTDHCINRHNTCREWIIDLIKISKFGKAMQKPSSCETEQKQIHPIKLKHWCSYSHLIITTWVKGVVHPEPPWTSTSALTHTRKLLKPHSGPLLIYVKSISTAFLIKIIMFLSPNQSNLSFF